MKTKMNMLKSGLVALLLMGSTTLIAQVVAPLPQTPVTAGTNLDVGTINQNTLPVTTLADAILFYNPATDGPSITLQATLDDGNGLTFDSYDWIEVTFNGTEEIFNGITGQTTNELELTELAPGYHKYRVYGIVDNDGVECQSDDFQDIIIFVLRPLDPSAAAAVGAIQEYCENDIPAGNLELSGTVLFDTDVTYNGKGYSNPDVDDFDLTYRWYAVNSNDVGTQIPLTTPPTSTNAGATSSLQIPYADLNDAGTYTFFVEVQYSNAIKDRGTRAHAIWNIPVTENGNADVFELVVSPTPGRPIITIEAVND